MFRLLYNLLLPPLALFATPFWLWKTHKRGGLSERLLEKLARYDAESPQETGLRRRPIYLHAVSVGEVNIARKLITGWNQRYPAERFLLAVGTSTGFDLARHSPPPRTEVLYAPLDIPILLTELFARYRPVLIVLIEHEVWPNLMHTAAKNKVPVALANARLSQRSGERLKKFRPLLGKFYAQLAWAGAQSDSDQTRLAAIGISEEALVTVGSVKFDPALDTPTATELDPLPLLDSFGTGPILMALSTHSGEELAFAKAAASITDARIVIIPRHMERREEIISELNEAGIGVLLRSTGKTHFPKNSTTRVLVVDSTGEMPAFTPQATVAFIGKTLFGRGGQNPCEAIAAGIPVVAGPHLGNFEPLATELRNSEGIRTVSSEGELASTLLDLVRNPQKRKLQSQKALSALEFHRGATTRTIEALAKLPNLG